jgi:hypothetical protein
VQSPSVLQSLLGGCVEVYERAVGPLLGAGELVHVGVHDGGRVRGVDKQPRVGRVPRNYGGDCVDPRPKACVDVGRDPRVRGLHSSTFRINVLIFCGKRWVVSVAFNNIDQLVQTGHKAAHGSNDLGCAEKWTSGNPCRESLPVRNLPFQIPPRSVGHSATSPAGHAAPRSPRGEGRHSYHPRQLKPSLQYDYPLTPMMRRMCINTGALRANIQGPP